MNRPNIFPPPGLCSLSALPDPYRTAFRMGSAHHLPGQFLPAQTDWFLQIFLLPFMLMYASPGVILGGGLIIQAIQQPASYGRFVQTVRQQSLIQIGFTLLLLLLIAVLVVFCSYQAWDQAQSLYRTWDAHRARRKGNQAYGLVLLSHGIVGRLVDNLEGQNCLWLPRRAIAEIAWQRIREEGAKHSRWVNRTCICYQLESDDRRWLTLRGDIVKLGHSSGDPGGDRVLYETLTDWWKMDAGKTE